MGGAGTQYLLAYTWSSQIEAEGGTPPELPNTRVLKESKTSLWDPFGGDGNVLKLDCGDGHATGNV